MELTGEKQDGQNSIQSVVVIMDGELDGIGQDQWCCLHPSIHSSHSTPPTCQSVNHWQAETGQGVDRDGLEYYSLGPNPLTPWITSNHNHLFKAIKESSFNSLFSN